MYDPIYSNEAIQNHFIGKIDPRAKLLLFGIFIAEVIASPRHHLPFYIFFIILLIAIVISSGIDRRFVLKMTVSVYPMIIFISFFQLSGHFHEGAVNPSGQADVSLPVWLIVLKFQLNTILIFIAGIIFVRSTPYRQMLKSIEWLRLPSWVVSVIFFVYQFLFILSFELNRLIIALRSRYIRLNYFRRIKVLSMVSTTYLVRIFDRNERLYRALISRGFNGSIPLRDNIIWRGSDTVIVLFFGTVILILPLFI
jgi:cobalt/nickel transport system permease protein